METGISDFWRKNTSNLESRELANVLRAMRKVAGYLGGNVGLVEYAGMSSGASPDVLIDPDLVMGTYPVPGVKVDHVVALVTHEALHKVEWTDRVWKLLEPAFGELHPLPRVAFQKVVYTGEDIYVDFIAEQKIFRLYVREARKRAINEKKIRLRRNVLSLDALVYLWWAGTWEEVSQADIDEAYKAPLKRLMRLNDELKTIGRSRKGVTARCQTRADLYLETWRDLEESVSKFRILDKRLYWYPDSFSVVTADKPGDSASPAFSFPEELDLGIKEALAAGSTDLTPMIRSVVGEEDKSVVPISRWDYTIGAHPMVDPRTVYRLKAIFQTYAGENKVVSRGLESGRVDSRRLYRAPVNGRCFKQIDRIPNQDWSVTLLLDASGSMKGHKWRMVENTVANLHRALQGQRNRLQVYAYFESDGICMISQLSRDDKLFSVNPHGQTASGQAIIAAAWLMDKKRPRKIMIHVTDGESNLGCDVRFGIKYCRKEKIHLITLGCGNRDRESMEKQYGKTIQFIDHYEQLPKAMESLLKWTFLYGDRPHQRIEKWLNLNKPGPGSK